MADLIEKGRIGNQENEKICVLCSLAISKDIIQIAS